MIEKVIVMARGHENIRSLHRTTLEITKDESLTPRGDCIVAVGADKALKDFPESFKRLARNSKAKITVTLEVSGIKEVITGRGDEGLSFEHTSDIVVRKSTFICPRTLMVEADKAARDISRELVEKLKNPEAILKAEIVVELR